MRAETPPQHPIQEILRFDPKLPLEKASTPPASWYLDPKILELEKQKVFFNSWQYACSVDSLKEVGDYTTGRIMSEPFVVVRGQDQALRAFHNVCRHHATQVARGSGKCAQLVCPYHGWTYELDGALRSATRSGLAKEEMTELGLKPVRLEIWSGLVFLHFGMPEKSVAESIPLLGERLKKVGVDHLKFSQRVCYPMDCNWKVYVDNYLDGGYHVAHLHSELTSSLDLSSYDTEFGDLFSIQSCMDKGNDERLKGGALYAWTFPNLMINRYGPMMDINWVVPTGPETCEVIFDYFFEEGMDEAFVDSALEKSSQVQLEDIDVSERVQRGLRSRSYDQGRYAQNFEAPMFHFHKLLANFLRL